MSKKTFFVILVPSLVVNEVVAIVDAIKGGRFLAGEAGLPFRFSSATLFGTGSVNYGMLFLDIVFWFAVIWISWKLLGKVLKR